MLGKTSSSMWELMEEIEEMSRQGLSAEKIAEELNGETVRGGMYEMGVKVGDTTYYLPILQP